MADTNTSSSSFKDVFLRIVAIIGLIAIIILGAWGIIQITFNLPNLLSGINNKTSSLFTSAPKAEALTVSVPQIAYTGEPLTISWNHQNQGTNHKYSYTVSYSCANGLVLRAPTPVGTFQNVPCATPFNFVNANSSMQVVPFVTGPSQASTTISVSAISLADGTVSTSGQASVAILPPRNILPATTTPQVQKPVVHKKAAAPAMKAVYAKTRYSNPRGLPDLSVSILSVTPQGNGLSSARFVIQNIGTKVTPSGWSFTASLPVGYAYTYYSDPQQALYPGDKIVYTLTFSQTDTCQNQTYSQYQSPCYPTYQNGSVQITVDPDNYIRESNKTNNTASVPFQYY